MQQTSTAFATLAPPRFTRFYPKRCLSARPPSSGTTAPLSTSTSSSVSACAAAAPNISQLARSIRSGETTATANLDRTLSRLSEVDGRVGSFLTVDTDALYTAAITLDDRLRSGDEAAAALPLAGVPVAVKDNLCTRGLATTGGSRILDGFVPAYDATAVERLRAAGALVLGKTNMDEFGMGSTTELSAYKRTRNPVDLSAVPGGSSGGSAAAVAAGLCPGALGSDTGGSIRQPAAFCGVSGIRPSYGRVSRYGLLAYASSLDTVGPIASSVEDVALLMSVIAGHDARDATSSADPVPDYVGALYSSGEGAPLAGLRVGIIKNSLDTVEQYEQQNGDGGSNNIISSVLAAADVLKQLGADVVSDVTLPNLDSCVPSYYVLATSEASANLARYDGVRYGVRDVDAQTCTDVYTRSRSDGFGDEVKRRIMLGTFSLSSGYYDAYYAKAQRVRRVITRDIQTVFEQKGIDVLLSPVTPSPPFRFGQCMDDPLFMYLNDILTLPASLAGIPAVSVPCGVTPAGLPVGLQVMAPYMRDDVALRVAHAFQTVTSHHVKTRELVDRSLATAS